MVNQLSSSAEGCMDVFLTLTGELIMPEEFLDWGDGYKAEIQN
jgi:hypothetical protein